MPDDYRNPRSEWFAGLGRNVPSSERPIAQPVGVSLTKGAELRVDPSPADSFNSLLGYVHEVLADLQTARAAIGSALGYLSADADDGDEQAQRLVKELRAALEVSSTVGEVHRCPNCNEHLKIVFGAVGLEVTGPVKDARDA